MSWIGFFPVVFKTFVQYIFPGEINPTSFLPVEVVFDREVACYLFDTLNSLCMLVGTSNDRNQSVSVTHSLPTQLFAQSVQSGEHSAVHHCSGFDAYY